MADLISKEGSPLVTVCRDYHLPPYLSPDSLVIASSYSGNTEETVAAFEEALERGAKVVAVTTGGRLLQLAERAGVPVFRVDYEGEPRTALGYSFLVPLAMLQNLGLSPGSDEAVLEATEELFSLGQSLSPETPTHDNPAKELAVTLRGKMIVVFGGGMLCGVARRWKTQFNENAKAWAFVELLPEAGHNAIAGLWWPRPMGRKVCGVLLNSLSLHPRIKLRYRVIQDLLGTAGVECRTVDGVGQSHLAQILSFGHVRRLHELLPGAAQRRGPVSRAAAGLPQECPAKVSRRPRDGMVDGRRERRAICTEAEERCLTPCPRS